MRQNFAILWNTAKVALPGHVQLTAVCTVHIIPLKWEDQPTGLQWLRWQINREARNGMRCTDLTLLAEPQNVTSSLMSHTKKQNF